MTTNDIQNSVSTPELLLRHGYKYLEQIGEGSNGKTYKAKNLKTGEIVAIKALKFSDNLKNYELFEREAQTLKSIHTPGTPVFYNYITSGSEFTECWLVQEYVQGKSIFDKLENGQTVFTEGQTLRIILEAAQIIQTLQTKYTPPIIHRDIKPSNILVRETRKDDMKLCLIDFGAVANPQRRGVNSTVAGTVGYMAPEQLIGDCTIQSDYYALGATALHMLTGINPSEIPSDGFTLQFEDTLKQKVPTIHKETIALLHKLLATNPSDRPKDANDLIQQIAKTFSSFNDTNSHLESKIKKLKTFNNIIDISVYRIPVIIIVYYIVIFIILGNLDVSTINRLQHSKTIVLTLVLSIFSIIPVLFILKFFTPKIIEYNIKKKSELPQNRQLTMIPYSERNDDHIKKGVIQAIHDRYVEYTVTNGKNCYAAFIKVDNPQKYKVGDTITLS